MPTSLPDLTSSLPSYGTTNSILKWLMSISPRASNAGHRSTLTKPIIALVAVVLLAAACEEMALASRYKSPHDESRQITEPPKQNLLAKIYFKVNSKHCAYRICKYEDNNCTANDNYSSERCISNIKNDLLEIISAQKAGCPTKNTALGVVSDGNDIKSEKSRAESRAKYICNAIGENCTPKISEKYTENNNSSNYRVDLFSLETCQDKKSANASGSAH